MFANLYLVFAFWKPAIYPAALHTSTTVRAIALLNLVVFGYVVLMGTGLASPASWMARHRARLHLDPRSQTAP